MSKSSTPSAHTPTPWKYIESHKSNNPFYITENNKHKKYQGYIAEVNLQMDESAEANAKRIVHCVNNFDEIVEALEKMIKTSHEMYDDEEHDPDCTMCEATKNAEKVISKAKANPKLLNT